MSGGVDINAVAFHRRAKAFQHAWASEPAEFNSATAVLILAGKADDAVYLKSSSLQQWLLGYGFPDSMIIILPEKVVFVLSQKRATYLEDIERGRGVTDKVNVEILRRTKDEATNTAIFEQVLGYLSKGPVATLTKEKPEGKFVDEWNSFLKARSAALKLVDASAGLAVALASKDEDDQKCVETAAKLTSLVMRNNFVEEFQGIVSEGKKVTHDKLCTMTEACLTDEKKFAKLKFPRE
ncbi:FACT complex subunit spt16, partial [Cladochytrium tenue]